MNRCSKCGYIFDDRLETNEKTILTNNKDSE